MSLSQLARWWDSGWSRLGSRKSRAGGRARPRTSFRPQVQGLEDRYLLCTVTSLSDSGPGSLRQCIIDTPTTGTVDFDKGLSGTITLTSAPLAINKFLTIAGPGDSVITVSGNHARQVFNIPAPWSVTISGLTIANGTSANGGGIFNGGALTISNCTFSGNTSNVFLNANGGAINNANNLIVTNSTFRGNSTGGGSGGAISNTGTLTLTNSTLIGNSAIESGGNGGYGGGIFNTGNLTVTSSTISNNSASYYGGGIHTTGTLGLTSSTANGNSASSGGGGISNAGNLTVTSSTISNNSTTSSGGGITNLNSGTLNVSSSTFSGNSAASNGGGINNVSGGNVTIARSTFNLNAAVNGASIAHTGTGTVSLTSSTLSGNIASNQGGGIFHSGSGRMMTLNTIIAGNRAFMPSVDVSGALDSQGYNLIGNGTGGSGYTDTDLVGTADMPIDPLLGPLQDNGGSTFTMAVLPGSPALNAGDPDLLDSASDQRGVVRSGGVNIGAYQASATAFVVSAPAKVNPGVPFDVAVTAVDPFGQPACGYVGTVTFSTTDPDPGVVLPADYTFTLEDGGAHTFSDTGLGETTLLTHGHQTLAVTDTADGSVMGSVTVKVKGSRLGDSSDSSSSERQAVVAGDRFFAALASEDFGWLAARPRRQGFGEAT